MLSPSTEVRFPLSARLLAILLLATCQSAKAQDIPVKLEILTDGAPEQMNLTGPSSESLSPNANQEWRHVSTTRNLSFGQNFNFNFNHGSTPSETKTGNGPEIVASSHSYGGAVSANMYSNRYSTAEAPHESNNGSGNCDGFACISCGYSGTANASTSFSAGTYGSYTKRNDNGSTSSQSYSAPTNINQWDIYQADYSGYGNNYLRLQQGSSIAPSNYSAGWSSWCGNNSSDFDESCNCNDSQALPWIQGRSGNISEFEVVAKSTCSGNCGSCTTNAQAHGCLHYSVNSTNGAATTSQYSYLTGTIGTNVWISAVEADFTGSASNQVDLWLVKGNKKLHLFNNHSHSGSNHDLNFRDGNTTIGNSWNNSSYYRPAGGNLNAAFAGASSDGYWTLEAYDNTSGTRHSINYFKIHFKKVPNGEFRSDVVMNSNQVIGDGVYVQTLTVNHNLAAPSFSLVAPNGTTYSLGNLANGEGYNLHGEATDTYEGINLSGTWKLKATSTNMTADMFNGISSWSISFSGLSLNGNNCAAPGDDRIYAARVYPDQLDPNCSSSSDHYFYQNSGTTSPSVDLQKMVSRKNNHPELAALGHEKVALKLVAMGDGIFDAYDLANDLHYTAARINGNSVRGQEVMRSNPDWTEPLVTAIWASEPGSHATDGHTYALPASDHLKAIEYATTSGPAEPTFLALSSGQYSSALHPTLFTGNHNWMNQTAFGDDHTQWNEWLVITPDPLAKLDLLNSSSSTYYSWRWTQSGIGSINSNLSSNYVNDIDLSALSISQLESPTLRGSNLLNGHSSGATIKTIDLREETHDMWRLDADVQTYYSSELVTRYEQGTNFETGKIHISFPITAPKYNSTTFEDVPYSGADAVNSELPYWGIPNGVEGYAEMHVRIKNNITQEVFTKNITSNEEPLMLKDCPFLIQDSVRMEVNISEILAAFPQNGSAFSGGDEVEISAMVFWSTPARRTALWSFEEADNREILCTDMTEFSMNEGPAEISGDGNSSITVTWNDGLKCSGGYMRLQRRKAADADDINGGWLYIDDNEYTTPNIHEARVWNNQDDDGDGYPDAITYTDYTLLHSEWECHRVEYRVEQDMCGSFNYTEPIGVTILGSLESPWVIDGGLSNGITVSEGRYPFKVKIDWATAIDQSGNIAQFRVYRRPYQPAVSNDDFEQIFSSEDFTWYIDQDIAAGTLYEYKVGAVMTCSSDDPTAPTEQEFYPPAPYPIGFRSSMGVVSGEILFEDGSPSGNVIVNVTPQSLVDARNSLELEENEYLTLDLKNLNTNSSNVWPNIHSDVPGDEWSLSQWIQVPENTVSNHVEFPLVSFNIEDPETQVVSEAFSIWGNTSDAPAGHFDLKLKQAGNSLPFLPNNIQLKDDTYYHLTLNLKNSATAPNLIIGASVLSDESSTLPAEVGTRLLSGTAESLAEMRAGWHSITWNAAGAAALECGDPFATNFSPLAISSSQDECNYNDIGCTDPEITSSAASFDANLAESSACDYSSLGYGELITLRWFSDASNNAHEAPAIFDMSGGSPTLVHNFHQQLQDAFDADPSGYPYSMPVMSVKLPEGNYRVRVLNNNLPSLPDANNFSGNFSVHNDRGVEYVNCIQYLTSEVVDGVYDFTINSGSCDLTTTPGAVNNLMTDCAECYSLSFDAGPASYELHTTPAGRSSIGNTPTFTFWFRGPTQAGQIFKAVSTNAGNVRLNAVADLNDPSNTGGLKFALIGPNNQILNRSVAAPYNEYNLIPGQWYHATLHLGQSGTGSFTLRSTNLNDGDAEPWNSTREFIFGQGTVNVPFNNSNGFTLSSLELGGADILLHSLSIWSGSLSKGQSLELYDGILSSELYHQNSNFTNIDGLWANVPPGSLLDYSKLRSVLIPDNSGRLTDQMLGKQLYPDGHDAGQTGAPNFQVTGAIEPTGMPIGSTSNARQSVRRAPYGLCNPGCARISNACNFNPFANQHNDCQLACAGVTAETTELISHPANYDEIRGWTGADYHVLNEDTRINQSDHPDYQQPYLSWELAHYWARRYPDNLTAGLFLMYDADESLGSVLYDRSKYAADADGWNHNNAQIMKQSSTNGTHVQSVATPGDMYYSQVPRNLPQTLGNWSLSSEINGVYLVPNIKYQGASSTFDIEANKSTDGYAHTFEPGMQVSLIGDIMLSSENRDFTDVSAFDVDIDVVYQALQPGSADFSAAGTPIPSECPVKGVRFKVDGVVAKGADEQPLETNSYGQVTLQLTRGNHLIVPTLDHLDEASSDDDHTFYLASSDGNTVTVNGPMLRTGSGAPVTMIDITTRRAVGRVIGGEHQASKPWNTSTNNLGIAHFQLVKEYGTSDSPVTTLAENCPAVDVTTNLMGEYDVQLLPGQYRIATSIDYQDPSIPTWSQNSFTGFSVDGWMGNQASTDIGNTGNTWVSAFPQHIKDNGSGGYNNDDVTSYSIWDMTEKQQWDQSAEYPSHPIVQDATYIPSDAYARVDLVFTPPVEISVNQLTVTTNSDGESVCANDNPAALTASLGPVFLGAESLTVKNDEGVEYISPMMHHLMAHKSGVDDPVVNDVDLVPPFPLGLPLIHTGKDYCSAIKAIRTFSADIPAQNHAYQDTALVKGEQYGLSIQNTLADPQFVSTIPLSNEDAGTAYGFAGAAPSFNPNDRIPRGFLQIKLLENGQEKATWSPFKSIMGSNPDLTSVPGLMKSPVDQSILLQTDRFDAILMGSYISAPPVPISSDPELDFILRDPPGDQSYCSLEQGSTFSFEKTINSGNQHSKSRERNIEVIPAVDISIGGVLAPLGLGAESAASFSIDAEWGYARQENYTKSLSGDQTIREEISAVETVSTSSEEQSGIYGNNQDLYYGTVRNTAIGFTKHHKMISVPDALVAGMTSGQLTTLGIAVDNAPVFHFQDSNGDGAADFPMFFKKADNGNIDPSQAAFFTFEWCDIPSKTLLPASFFMKTEYTIENVDIPTLEAVRDHYFKTSGYYDYPDGQPANTPESALGWTYPEGMKYANNDDHRWELFHKTFLDERHAANPAYPNQASTLQKGYQIDADIFSDLDGSTQTNMANSITAGTAGFDASFIARLQAEATNGDDREGPGYRFSVSAAQLAAAQPTDGSTITEIQLDSVRYYNNQIAAWKLMLAQNEFEKLNARKYIMDNVEEAFSDPAQLSTWIEDLQTSASEVNNWSINDFSSIAEENGNLQGGELGADNSIWDEADFEPFFLNFSGGGSTYTNSLTKTNITEVSNTKALSGVWNGSSGGGLLIGGAGLVASEGEETVITETRKNTEGTASSVNYTYSLSDDDEQDFFLVCVVPGKGLNGPMFLNLGSASSCPHIVEQPSEYSEWYAALVPTEYNLTGPVDECSSVSTPVWNSTLNVSTIKLSTTQGSVFHAYDTQTYEDEVVDIATGNNQTNEIAGAFAIAAGIVTGATMGVGFPLGIQLLGFGAGFAAMGAIEEAVASGWRNEVWADFGSQFSLNGYSASDLQAISLATEETDLFIADGMCSIITEQDDSTRAANTIVQPSSVPIENPKLTLTHDGNSGLESVNITQLMTEGINLSFQLEHQAPEPWGGPSKYYLFNDATNTTLAANISLGGGDPATGDYLLYPNWSDGPYSILGNIEHNGIEDEQYMNGHVDFIMRSSCDFRISDTVRVNINYEPACSDVTLTAPLDNWTANLDLIESGDYSNTEGNLALHVDVDRNDFQNWVQDTAPIVVEYRTGNGTQWSTISPDTLSLNANGTMRDVDFEWAPLDGGAICNMFPGADSTYCLGYEGEVLLRAYSVCENEFAIPQVSPIVTGYVDFIRPELFGSVLPADGFYEQGDELMLRWNEPMETTDPNSSLNPNNIEMWAVQNTDFTNNTGGIQFTGQEHVTVLQASELDAAGWSATWSLWAGGVSEPTTITPGVIFCQGDHNSGSLSVELRNTEEIAVVYRAQGNVIDEAVLILPSASAPNWNPTWNEFELTMSPNGTNLYDVTVDLNRTGTIGTGTLNIPNFNLPSRRLTIGNGWSGPTAAATPLTMPMQNFRLWSSQREHQLAANGEYIITGQELGLQVYLPMDEMGGTPVERSRNRPIIMEANWFGTHDAAAIDFSGNTGNLRPEISGQSFSSTGGKNTTVEFWMKPGGTDEAIMGIGGSTSPNIDTEMTNWSFQINGSGNLVVHNGGNTLQTSAPLSDAWHHIALVRHNNGSANLYVDGDNVDSGSPNAHGQLQPLFIFLGARQNDGTEFTGEENDGDALNYDMPFTGKFDELRVWSTALPLNTVRQRMRDGVYGYDNLVLHAPFEARGSGEAAIASTEAYGYTAWDGYTTNNNDGSLGMPNSFNALTIAGLSETNIQNVDAPLMQFEPQQVESLPGDVASVSWNSLSDEVIVELDENALYKYEDQLVTFKISKSELKDAAGNSIADDLSFDFLIDRNPLKWGEEFLELSGQPTEDLVMETSVVNIGNQSKYFEITGLPTWIDVSPSSGIINANSSTEVTFTVTSILPAGEYTIDAKLKGGLPCGTGLSGFCYAERLTMNLDLFLEAPELNLDPSPFANSIPMIAKVFNGNIASSNERDIVMAYVGEELRGFSQLDMVVADQNLAFLNVFYDEVTDASANVTFRVWDASSGVIRALVEPHWPDLDSSPITISLSNNEPPPFSVFEPLLLKSTDKVEIQSELTPGWNWVSVNVVNDPETTVEDAFKSVDATHIAQIKAHNAQKVYYTSNQWQPDAQDAVDPNMRYEVQMNTGGSTSWTMSNIGTMADHEVYTQSLVTGWNDLGYVPQQTFSVQDALLSLADAETILGFDDLITSRYDGFAVHVGDGEWVGSLETLEPGQGYRLYLDDSDGANLPAGTLEWPASFAHMNPGFRTSGPAVDGLVEHDDVLGDNAAWPMNVQDLESSMPMIVRLELPSNLVPSMGDLIGAFTFDDEGNEICVGQGLPRDTEEGLLYFLTVYGDAASASELTFQWKSGLSDVELVADELLSFTPSRLKGTPGDPFMLHFSRAGMDMDLGRAGELVAYPNPFVNEIAIHWHGESAVKSLSVQDANGRLVSTLDCDGLMNGPCRWDASHLEQGVYFIHAVTDDGQFAVRLVK